MVCKRWYRLCEPLLLHTLQLNYFWWESPRRIASLQRKLKALKNDPNPSCHVQVLSIYFRGSSLEHTKTIVTVLGLCKLLRKLNLDLAGQDFLPVIKAAADLSHLQQLRLARNLVAAGAVLKYCNQPSLRSLHLSHYYYLQPSENGKANLGFEPARFRSRDPVLRYHAEKDITAAAGGVQSAVVTLMLKNSKSPPDATELLVRRFQNLEHVCLSGFSSRLAELGYNFESVQRILDIHRSTFHTISLSTISLGLPDLSAFLSLSRLGISEFLVREKSPAAVSCRLPLSLMDLIIYYTNFTAPANNSSYTFRTTFTPWILEFAVYHRNSKGEGNALSTIGVTLAFDWWCSCEKNQVWPYECVEELRRELAKQGIKLVVEQPRYSNDEWQEILAEVERKMKRREQAKRRMIRYFRPDVTGIKH